MGVIGLGIVLLAIVIVIIFATDSGHAQTVQGKQRTQQTPQIGKSGQQLQSGDCSRAEPGEEA